ncbi:MAG: DUF5320 domain-containing protein [Flavobacteriales bacterium]|nr:DUF5320 domain-containing protein [Flavobacteriales bacterium]
MSLIKRIEVFLESREQTLENLADYLQMDLDELVSGISDNSVEVRTLENISKALRIPLYSFFPGFIDHAKKHEIPYYDRRLPNEANPTIKTEIEMIQEEIRFLTKYLKNRQKQLEELQKG